MVNRDTHHLHLSKIKFPSKAKDRTTIEKRLNDDPHLDFDNGTKEWNWLNCGKDNIESAAPGFERCRQFLKEKNPLAMIQAAQMIEQHFSLLESDPEFERPLDDLPALRELIIPFGNSVYVALYRFEESDNVLYVLPFWHQKEAGY